MENKKLAGTILSVSVRVCIFALVVIFICFFGKKAFGFGQSIFDERSVDEKGYGYDAIITIPSGASNSQVADILLDNGLIEDKILFLVQLKLSDYSKSILPGTYVLSTTMKPTEIMMVLSTEPETSAGDKNE